jgi:hypothetical protein
MLVPIPKQLTDVPAGEIAWHSQHHRSSSSANAHNYLTDQTLAVSIFLVFVQRHGQLDQPVRVLTLSIGDKAGSTMIAPN